VKNITFLFSAALILTLTSCEKEITVDLPEAESLIVVEGTIENGFPPIIFLSQSQGYFDPINAETLQNFYLCDAEVTLTVDGQTDTLDMISAASLSPEQLELVADLIGVPAEQIVANNFCAYTTFNPAFWGQFNKEYSLKVLHNGRTVTAKTKLNTAIPLDSLWFDSPSGNPTDSLGFLYASISDPDTLGNCYRWSAKRINKYTYAPAEESFLIGQVKDQDFIYPFNSVTDDAFFNGLSFEFSYYRGRALNSEKYDDKGEEGGYYKLGDTVVVKDQTIDYPSFQFIFDFENQGGGPFALPYNLKSNVVGGLGAFIAYGSTLDTVICVK